MPQVARPRQRLKLVSAAGLAPAIPRSLAEGVGCYATRWGPASISARAYFGGDEPRTPLACLVEDGGPEGICTLILPADNGLLRCLSYGSVKWWEVLVNSKGRKRHCTPGPCHFNKEQTPPGDLFNPSPRFHGGSFGV
jgi:hypothetical protein